MSALALYLHSALPLVSLIELQCIYVETLLSGSGRFRGVHVAPDVGFLPNRPPGGVVGLNDPMETLRKHM